MNLSLTYDFYLSCKKDPRKLSDNNFAGSFSDVNYAPLHWRLCPGDGAVHGLYYGHPVYGSIMLMSSWEIQKLVVLVHSMSWFACWACQYLLCCFLCGVHWMWLKASRRLSPLSQLCSCTSSPHTLVFHSSEWTLEFLFPFSCWKASLTMKWDTAGTSVHVSLGSEGSSVSRIPRECGIAFDLLCWLWRTVRRTPLNPSRHDSYF